MKLGIEPHGYWPRYSLKRETADEAHGREHGHLLSLVAGLPDSGIGCKRLFRDEVLVVTLVFLRPSTRDKVHVEPRHFPEPSVDAYEGLPAHLLLDLQRLPGHSQNMVDFLYCAELTFLRFFDMVSKFTDLNWLQFFVQAFRGLIQLRGYKAAAELLKKEKTSDAVSPSNGK